MPPRFSRPTAGEYPAYFETYLRQVTESDALGVLANQIDEVRDFFFRLPPGKADHAYAPGKWTIKEIVGHLSDTERVMAYRAMSFARADPAPLPGFDENAWVPPAGFGERTLTDLLDEWLAVRRATIALLVGLPAGAGTRTGTASGKPLSVRTVAFMLPGHVRHHLQVIRERYL